MHAAVHRTMSRSPHGRQRERPAARSVSWVLPSRAPGRPGDGIGNEADERLRRIRLSDASASADRADNRSAIGLRSSRAMLGRPHSIRKPGAWRHRRSDRSPRDADIDHPARRPRVPTLLGVLCLSGGLATFAGGHAVEAAAALSATRITSSTEQTHPTVGAYLNDTATLANTTTLDGSGSIKFTLYGPGDTTCSTPVSTEIEGDITSDGPVSSESGTFIASEVGVYQWIAAFTGDLGNSPATTACGDEPVTITPDTTISTVASPSAAAPGAKLQDTATLMDTSTLTGTGSILFRLYAPDTFCAVLLYTETVEDATSDGPLGTTVGYTPTLPEHTSGRPPSVAMPTTHRNNPMRRRTRGDHRAPEHLDDR